MGEKSLRIAYLVSHPIQYQAPFLRYLAQEADFEVTTFFLSDFSVGKHRDPGFDTEVEWDVPLREGYRSVALTHASSVNCVRPFPARRVRRLVDGDFDALWVHGWAQVAQLWTVLSAFRRDIPVLLRGESVPGKRSFLRRWILRALVERAAAMLPIGRRNRAFYRSLGVEEQRLFDVPYAVDNQFFSEKARAAALRREDLRAELGLEAGRPVILYASKLIGRKRPHDLLQAYADLSPDGIREPEPYLLFAGDGDQRCSLEAQAQEHDWSSIRFLGFQNQTELPALYDLADVFCLPSVFETWGLVLNEAMNASCPLVVSRGVGAVNDLVVEGQTGLTHPAGDVPALNEALRRLLEDEGERRRMGRAARQRIAQFGFESGRRGISRALARVA